MNSFFLRRGESDPTLERATKFNPMFESDPVTTQYYRRYDDGMSQHTNAAVLQYASAPVTNEETLHIYQNTTLTPEVMKCPVIHSFIALKRKQHAALG